MSADKFTFEVAAGGLLAVRTAGFWSDDDADRYIAELRLRLVSLRNLNGQARVLVDGRDSVVQSASVMAKVAGIQSILIAGPQDRAAYVVPNNLGKLQAQRLSSTDQLRVFVSPDEARAWVLASAPDAGSR